MPGVLGGTMGAAYRYIVNNTRIRELKSMLDSAGDRRDWDQCNRIEKELYELTGDPDYAPYEEEDEETI